MSTRPEFSGLKGRFFAWFLTSPLRRILERKMGNPDRRLMELLALSGSETVIDSGCGSGHHTLMIAERLSSGRVIGIDVSPPMLAKLRRNAAARNLTERIEAIEADALAMPFPDASADCAITVAAWHHLDDPQIACTELARVLSPGGRFVAIDLEIGRDKQFKGHTRVFAAADMQRILETAGLDEIEIEQIGRWIIGAARKSKSQG